MSGSCRASDNQLGHQISTARVEDSNLPDGVMDILTDAVTCVHNLESPRTINGNFVRLELNWEMLQRDFRILYKDKRDQSGEEKRRLLSENDTCYENVTDKQTTYVFSYTFEQSSLVTITTRRGFSMTIIDTMKWFKKLGPGLRIVYDKLTTETTDDESKTRQEQRLGVTVSPISVVRVKHLVYEVEHRQRCVVEVTLKKNDILKYTYSEGYRVNGNSHSASKQQHHKMKVEKLIKMKKKIDERRGTMDMSTRKAFDAMTIEGDKLKVKFQANSKYTTKEHRLQTEEMKLNRARVKK